MYRVCRVCKTVKDYTPKESEGFSLKALHFCSPGCLRGYLKRIPRFSPSPEWLCLHTEPFAMARGSVFSYKLRRFFRSEFEAKVGEVLVLWGLPFLYEPYGLPVPVGAEILTYCPDFFIPSRGVWLEVKGTWRGNGREKFESALQVIGRDRLLLVPFFQYRRLPYSRGATYAENPDEQIPPSGGGVSG